MARLPILSPAWFVLLTGLGPTVVQGQTIPSPYRFFETRQEAGVFVGTTGQGTGRFGYGPSPGPAFGARYGIHLGGPFGLEGVFTYSPTTRDVVDPTREEGAMKVGEADVELLSFDVRLRFSLTGDRTWKKLNPFVFLGAGMIWDHAGESESDGLVLPEDRFGFGRKFLAPFGGGIRWVITRHVVARGDMAITLFQLKSPRGYSDPERDLEGVPEKEWVSGPTFSFGLGFHF